MKEKVYNMVYLDNIREKIGISPKKCIYEIEDGEVIISNILERETA